MAVQPSRTLRCHDGIYRILVINQIAVMNAAAKILLVAVLSFAITLDLSNGKYHNIHGVSCVFRE
jgi:hypothetical protein